LVWSLVYIVVRNLFALVWLLARPRRSKELENLVLRHELAILVEDAVPVLRKYIAEIRVTRPYFDATPSSSDEAVAAELSKHAVFRLIPER
jgi:hypothetical protein